MIHFSISHSLFFFLTLSLTLLFSNADHILPDTFGFNNVRISERSIGGHVVIYSKEDTRRLIYAAMFDQWGYPVKEPFPVSSYAGCGALGHQAQGSIAMLNNGFVIVWTLEDSSEVCLQAFDNNGVTKGSSIRVATEEGYKKNADVAGLTGGGYAVVWESRSHDESGYNIMSRSYDSEGNIVATRRVNEWTLGKHRRASITRLSDGGWAVAWERRGEGANGYDIFARTFDKNSEPNQEQEFWVNLYSENTQKRALACGLENGGLVVIWSSKEQIGQYYDIFGRIFDKEMSQVQEEFHISLEGKKDNDFPSIGCSFEDDGFVVGWISELYDGERNRGLIRRYTNNGNTKGPLIVIDDRLKSVQPFAVAAVNSDLNDGVRIISAYISSSDELYTEKYSPFSGVEIAFMIAGGSIVAGAVSIGLVWVYTILREKVKNRRARKRRDDEANLN